MKNQTYITSLLLAGALLMPLAGNDYAVAQAKIPTLTDAQKDLAILDANKDPSQMSPADKDSFISNGVDAGTIDVVRLQQYADYPPNIVEQMKVEKEDAIKNPHDAE
jgi:hypothetical protein